MNHSRGKLDGRSVSISTSAMTVRRLGRENAQHAREAFVNTLRRVPFPAYEAERVAGARVIVFDLFQGTEAVQRDAGVCLHEGRQHGRDVVDATKFCSCFEGDIPALVQLQAANF